MKVGLVSRHLGQPVGFGTYAENLVRELRARGDHDYVVYAPAAVPGLRSALSGWDLLGAPARAARDRVDVLHYLYPACPAAAGRPTVASVLDAITWVLPGYRLPRPYAQLERRAARRADRVITISESAAGDIAERLGTDAGRITVTYLGAPPVDPAPAPKEPYWLFVGGTERRKNLAAALAAFASGPFGRMRLKVVGSQKPSPIADAPADLLERVPAEVAARVDWLGRLEETALADHYRRALGLVFPSRYEGFGLPVLEAMARRTAVVAGRTSSIPEVAGDAALLVDPDDHAGLAAAMARIAEDDGLRRQLEERGAELAARFTWAETARRTAAVYDELGGRTRFA